MRPSTSRLDLHRAALAGLLFLGASAAHAGSVSFTETMALFLATRRDCCRSNQSGTTRNTQRIVTGQGGEIFYTPDHYGTFIRVNP